MKLGIIGAGHIARAVATLARRQGHEVMISNSRGPQSLAAIASELDCLAGSAEEAAIFGDLILVAVPFKACTMLDPVPFKGKIVMDACNYYPGRDGVDEALEAMQDTTGAVLARRLSGAHVVKAFNAILQRDIVVHARPAAAPDRRALPIAGDNPAARETVARWITELGFDVVDAGPMSESWRFERGMPAYCIPLTETSMRAALARAQLGQRAAEGSWREVRALA